MDRVNLIIRNCDDVVVIYTVNKLPSIEVKNGEEHSEAIWNFCISNGLQLVSYKVLDEEPHEQHGIRDFFYTVEAKILELPKNLTLMPTTEYRAYLYRMIENVRNSSILTSEVLNNVNNYFDYVVKTIKGEFGW